MARPPALPPGGGKGYPLRPCKQTFHERLMPCTQSEALERRQQAWRDRGIDSDEETVCDETQDKDKDEDDLQEEPAPLKARIHMTTVDMFKHVLLFSQGAAEALYDNQTVTTLDMLRDLTNDIIKELCRAIRKPGGDRPGHQISKLSMTRLKLFVFWVRHMWQTSRGVDDRTDTTYEEIKTLTNQKTLKDNLLDSKPPETPAMTLDPHSAAKAIADMLIILGKMRGIAGHPLSYVPRLTLKGPYDADMDDETEDPLPFGQPGSPYVSINNELCRRAPILLIDLSTPSSLRALRP
jgi:hypothetical protein